MPSRRLLRWLLLAWLLALLAACATRPGSLDIPRSRLEAALARRFPYEDRRTGLFVVNVGLPRLELQPEFNRVRLEFPLEASDRIVRATTRGELGVSFALRYEPSDASLRAANVRVDRLALQGFPSEFRGPLEAVGSLVAENLLEGAVLHTFRAEDLARAQGWTPGAIRVMPGGVHIDLVPPA